jgi:hypothetical protein
MPIYPNLNRPAGFFIIACLIAASSVLRAQPAPGAPDTAAIRGQIERDIRYLSSDELAGRRTGTPENLLAANYVAKRFKTLGLEPVPGGEDYFHTFSYLAGADPGNNNSLVLASRSGKGGSVTLTPWKDFVPLSFSRSGSVTADMVFVGYGITAPDIKYDDYAGIDAKGKIAVIMRYSPDGASPHGDFARYAAWTRKVSNAKEHGVAGIIFINQPRDSAMLMYMPFDRSFTGADIPALYALSTAVGMLRGPKGQSLSGAQEKIDRTKQPASFPLAFQGRMSVDMQLRRVMVPNVVGMIPGNDPSLRDEIIVVGAHMDHLGLGGEGSLYSGKDRAIHHGADDNASGVAGMLALAEHFASARSNRRTLVFMGFNGEEEGLLGSDAFVKNPPFPLTRVATMVNLDMIGRLDSNSLIVQGTGTAPNWDSLLNNANHGAFTLKLVKDGYGPSDHSSFYGKDLPVLAFFTGLHSDYHRPSDTWEKINYPGEVRIVNYVAAVIAAIDAEKVRPSFTKVQSATPRSSTGFMVYVGSIPDYAYDGNGLRLSGVADGGPAQKAGLQAGDIIIRMRTKTISNIYDYTDALGEFNPKDSVETEFLRNGKHMTTTIVMGSR